MLPLYLLGIAMAALAMPVQGRYFSGPARATELATVRVPKPPKPNEWRPLANLACVTRMHEVRDARGTFTY